MVQYSFIRIIPQSSELNAGPFIPHVHKYSFVEQSTICDSRKYLNFIIQLCSGIMHGRVLNGELYAHKLQKLIYVHLFTDCVMKISLQSLEQTYSSCVFVPMIRAKSSWNSL